MFAIKELYRTYPEKTFLKMANSTKKKSYNSQDVFLMTAVNYSFFVLFLLFDLRPKATAPDIVNPYRQVKLKNSVLL